MLPALVDAPGVRRTRRRWSLVAEAALKHPAAYSPAVIDAFVDLLSERFPDGSHLLDPFAGSGRVHRLGEPDIDLRYETIGVELEVEWAAMHGRGASMYHRGWDDNRNPHDADICSSRNDQRILCQRPTRFIMGVSPRAGSRVASRHPSHKRHG